MSDAEGVLAGLVSFGAKAASINAVAREAALWLAPTGRHLLGLHIWSEQNVLTDALSRLPRGAAIPESVLTVPRAQVDARGPAAWHVLGHSITASGVVEKAKTVLFVNHVWVCRCAASSRADVWHE